MKNKETILIIFLIVMGLNLNFAQINKKDIQKYKLEKHLPKNQVESLYYSLENFDAFLSKNYKQDIILFIKDLSNCYSSLCEGSFNCKELIHDKTLFNSSIKMMCESGLMEDIIIYNYKDPELNSVLIWRDSIQKLMYPTDYIVDQFGISNINDDNNNPKVGDLKIDTIRNEVRIGNEIIKKLYYFNIYSNFYYGLYQSVSIENEPIKKYIEYRVGMDNISPCILITNFLDEFTEKELNHPLMKVIVFTEFYLPLLINNK